MNKSFRHGFEKIAVSMSMIERAIGKRMGKATSRASDAYYKTKNISSLHRGMEPVVAYKKFRDTLVGKQGIPNITGKTRYLDLDRNTKDKARALITGAQAFLKK